MWMLVAGLMIAAGGYGCERLMPVEAHNEIKVVDLQPPLPISPKNGRIIGSTNRVTLRWRASPGATRYALEVARSLRFEHVQMAVESDTTAYVVALERGFIYYWRVMARIPPHYESAWSDVWSFRILNEGEIIFD
jgi:hypothetical protein